MGAVAVSEWDPNVVYVAAAGALWGPSEERGVYKTIDGGKTWEKKLGISQHTGVIDIAMDPRDPDVIYAGAYQRERRNWSFLGGGPEGAMTGLASRPETAHVLAATRKLPVARLAQSG